MFQKQRKKAEKRRVDNELCDRELRLVEWSTESIIENGLGAAYRLHSLRKLYIHMY